MSAERRDTVVAPFTDLLPYLLSRLDAWAVEQREALRAEIKILVKAAGGQRLPGKLNARAARSFQDFHRLNACRRRGVRAVTTLPGQPSRFAVQSQSTTPALYNSIFPKEYWSRPISCTEIPIAILKDP
jgi:hypothetical protein